MKPESKRIECVHEGGPYLDHCWTCAPWWGRYYVCPTHSIKLKESGYCRMCKKYYIINDSQ